MEPWTDTEDDADADARQIRESSDAEVLRAIDTAIPADWRPAWRREAIARGLLTPTPTPATGA